MSRDKTSNHIKAPNAAGFVGYMRQVFGPDVKVLYVKEGDFQLGEKTTGWVPITWFPMEKEKKAA
jgi:hypothetical protein